jgi:iron-sulfur cluster assembly accessory protein
MSIENNFDFTVTDAAAGRIAEIITQQNLSDNHFFRLTVDSGGCSGYQYRMDMDDDLAEDDYIIERGGVKTVIDTVSAPFLSGSILDYESSLGGSVLKVINPNATSSCGCGISFNA